MSVYEQGHDRLEWRRHWPALAGIAGIAAALIGFVLIPLRSPPGLTAPKPVILHIGKSTLELDANYLRRGAQRAGGHLERADLIVQWPDFRPAQLVVRDAEGSPAPASAANHLLIHIRAAEGADPARHTANLYGRFLDGDAWTSGDGLVMRRFKTNSPYPDEELFISPPDGQEFAARCPRQDVEGAVHGRCLVQMRIAQVDITVNFDAMLLNEWHAMRDGVLNLIARAIR